MSATAKFLFDRAFPASQAGGAAPVVFDTFDEEPQFRTADMEAARDEGFAEGRLAGLTEAQAGIEAATAAAIQHLTTLLDALYNERVDLVAEVRGEAAATAVATGRLLARALIERFPGAEIEALLAETVPQLHGEPRLSIRLAEPRLAMLAPRIDQITADAGFSGKVEVSVDPMLEGEDCRIEWSNGGVVRDRARVEAEVEAALARCYGTGTSRILKDE